MDLDGATSTYIAALGECRHRPIVSQLVLLL
jgi:hypothetical protein